MKIPTSPERIEHTIIREQGLTPSDDNFYDWTSPCGVRLAWFPTPQYEEEEPSIFPMFAPQAYIVQPGDTGEADEIEEEVMARCYELLTTPFKELPLKRLPDYTPNMTDFDRKQLSHLYRILELRYREG